jgi:hypothetical protein
LDFVDHGAVETSYETDRIGTSRAQRARVIERDIGTVGSGDLPASVVLPA